MHGTSASERGEDWHLPPRARRGGGARTSTERRRRAARTGPSTSPQTPRKTRSLPRSRSLCRGRGRLLRGGRGCGRAQRRRRSRRRSTWVCLDGGFFYVEGRGGRLFEVDEGLEVKGVGCHVCPLEPECVELWMADRKGVLPRKDQN